MIQRKLFIWSRDILQHSHHTWNQVQTALWPFLAIPIHFTYGMCTYIDPNKSTPNTRNTGKYTRGHGSCFGRWVFFQKTTCFASSGLRVRNPRRIRVLQPSQELLLRLPSKSPVLAAPSLGLPERCPRGGLDGDWTETGRCRVQHIFNSSL